LHKPPGGHSSQPGPVNAIQTLAAALSRLNAFAFPVQLNEVTRAYFDRRSELTGGATGQAMKALVSNSNDTAAAATLSTTPLYNVMMRTTCVVTKIQGGHATKCVAAASSNKCELPDFSRHAGRRGAPDPAQRRKRPKGHSRTG
jgi:hypothetical protein